MSGKAYEVVPQSLRATQDSYRKAAEGLAYLAAAQIPMYAIPPMGLGLLGRESGIEADYNGAIQQIEMKVADSCRSITYAADNLDTAAKAYEAQDEEYYKKFGWLDRQGQDGGVFEPDSSGGH
ncbi:hypothetical protein [Amycolatopsis benzoatilytica]|uniref:hypothetical protein n=1 Tax=Amycolatopsis benzoatilytica TaxID=346045 RepID=UPI00035FB887|nr:hypothetical protein [Amycolatopsis benzoatilytica]